MYNKITEELIKKIPHIEGVDSDSLPLFLTRSYAQIVSLRSKMETDKIDFSKSELSENYATLERIANTLEIMLLCNTQAGDLKSMAFVAAVARKLMGMSLPSDDSNMLSTDYLPVKLSSALLFVISGNLADAQEMAYLFDYKLLDNNWKVLIFRSISLLISGKLERLAALEGVLEYNDNIDEYATNLLWMELFRGIRRIGDTFVSGSYYDYSEFDRVADLSVENIGVKDQKEIYVGSYLLSNLLTLACKELLSHALIFSPAPSHVNPKDWLKLMSSQSRQRPYLWDNHIEAISKGILNVGISSVITFPTGAGKSTLSELKILSTLRAGRRCIYLVPTHALESQVNRNLKLLIDRTEPCLMNLGAEYSLLDETNDDKNIAVMTPEHCLMLMNVSPERLYNIGLVVFDEFHLISGDEDNARAIDAMTVMASLLDSHSDADFLLISAMVKNGREISGWIESITERPCVLLDSPWKPTSQLQGCLMYDEGEITAIQKELSEFRNNNPRKKGPSTKLKRSLKAYPKCLFSLKNVWDGNDKSHYYLGEIMDRQVMLSESRWTVSPNVNDVAANLAAKYARIGMKTIVFALQPNFANSILMKLSKLIAEDKSELLLKEKSYDVQRIAMELGGWEYSFLSDCTSATLHHSKLLPEERFLSEWYFKQNGGPMVIVATPTIAQGINLPADMVLIAGSSRYDDNERKKLPIRAHEILNAAGRAGRAGFRSQGTAILIPSEIITIGGDTITHGWWTLKDAVFSNGDNCLEITDPYNCLFDGKSNEIMLNRFKGDKQTLSNRIRKTFSAYLKKNNGVDVDSIIANLINAYANKEEYSWEAEIANKTFVNQSTVDLIYTSIEDAKLIGALSFKVSDMLALLEEVTKSNPQIFSDFPILAQASGQFGLDLFFKIVTEYIGGSPLVEIEKMMGKNDKKLKEARNFVINVIPNFSFFCGVFVMVLRHKVEEVDNTVELPKDVLAFASCIKEGMSSYKMLLEKYQNKWMRVECHNKISK